MKKANNSELTQRVTELQARLESSESWGTWVPVIAFISGAVLGAILA